MDHCGTETLQLASQFKMADRVTQSPFGVAQYYSVFLFPLQKLLCWKFRYFLLRNKKNACAMENQRKQDIDVRSNFNTPLNEHLRGL